MPWLLRLISAVATAITSLFVARRRLDFWQDANLVPQAGIRTKTRAFPLVEANAVIVKLRTGQISGATVHRP
jgi:hypothetical protein